MGKLRLGQGRLLSSSATGAVVQPGVAQPSVLTPDSSLCDSTFTRRHFSWEQSEVPVPSRSLNLTGLQGAAHLPQHLPEHTKSSSWLLGVQSALAQPETPGPAWTIAYGLFPGPLCCPLFNNQMPPAGLPGANHMLEWLSSFHDIISRYFSVCWVAPPPTAYG